MQLSTPTITPCLWFDGQAEEAARHYVSVIPGSRIGAIARYPDVGCETHGRAPGSVMTVEFELAGQPFLGLNGGPQFRFDEAVSFQIHCDTQDEIDHYWSRLSEGGEEGPCGWLKDRFGLSWQVVPSILPKILNGGDPAAAQRVMSAFMEMRKFDIAALERAHAG